MIKITILALIFLSFKGEKWQNDFILTILSTHNAVHFHAASDNEVRILLVVKP